MSSPGRTQEVGRPDAAPPRVVRDREAADPDNKGWNRISIIFWSRQPYRPQISPEDLRLPSGDSMLRALATCLLCGLAITVGYLWFVLFFVSIVTGAELGRWFLVIMGASPFVLGGVLFAVTLQQARRARALADTL